MKEKKKKILLWKNVLVVGKELSPSYCPDKECVAVGYSEQLYAAWTFFLDLDLQTWLHFKLFFSIKTF